MCEEAAGGHSDLRRDVLGGDGTEGAGRGWDRGEEGGMGQGEGVGGHMAEGQEWRGGVSILVRRERGQSP